MKEAVIVSGARTAVGRAYKGSLRTVRPDDMGGAVIKAALDRVPQLDRAEIDDVIIGCAMPEGEQGLNMARVSSFIAGLPKEVPAQTVNRFCSSGLQTIALGAQQIMSGMGEVVVAGGSESMSLVPMLVGNGYSPNPKLIEMHPEVYMPMGITAENVAEQYKVSRQEQDDFALRSHQSAAAAIDGGKFKDVIIPIQVSDSGQFVANE
jgi:acetyl-CoA acyltransferase